jgi:catechol 2,3-dioxygenase-like lactoylglutathione lyase family enzyme
MFDHLGFDVSDFQRSRAFYDGALKPLRIAVLMGGEAGDGYAGYGKTQDSGDVQAGKPSFWIAQGARPTGGLHVAFVAGTRAEVDAFHAAAMAAGGKDNGGPGVRAQYHPTYYGAFVLDPDGVNVEAVCHKPG